MTQPPPPPDPSTTNAEDELPTRRLTSVADMLVPPKHRGRRAMTPPRPPFPWVTAGITLLALLLVGGAVYLFWYGDARTGPSKSVLTDRQAQELDSLLVVADDHIERGSSLLELGLREGASQEFARAVNTLALSDLRKHPQVTPRIEGLEAAVGSIYRGQRMVVPEEYSAAKTLVPFDEARDASLSVEEFANAFDLVAAAFRARFGQAIEVTGRDHPEHLALYGKGGAMDLRSSNMTREEIDFVIDQCRSHQIRIKDFSRDSVLKAQVQAAVLAGLYDRAGTGLHLHIDRFAKRRDRWTVGIGPSIPDDRTKPAGYTSKNLSRDIPASENSAPSSSNVGLPRSNNSSSR